MDEQMNYILLDLIVSELIEEKNNVAVTWWRPDWDKTNNEI